MKEVVRKVRAGHLPVGRHAPCIPPWGNSRPPAPQNADVSGVKVAGVAPYRLCAPLPPSIPPPSLAVTAAALRSFLLLPGQGEHRIRWYV